mgnify:CR=1 FL=1
MFECVPGSTQGLGRGGLGRMPLGGGIGTLQNLIDIPSTLVFRNAHIKRRLRSTGLYEANWQNISSLVKKWGSIDYAVDDTRLNRFTFSGANLVVRNDFGDFNDETNTSSLWFGYLGRYKSLLRIQAGYQDCKANQFPTDPTQGIYVMTDEPEISGETQDFNLRASSLRSVFDGVKARDIPGLGATFTASEIVARVRDHTDGSGVAIFQQFISTAAWTIQTTTAYYRPQTDGSEDMRLEDMSAWDLMQKVAESEGFVLLVNRTGGLEFRNRDARTTTAAFDFRGQGFHPMNIIKAPKEREAINKLYNRFKLKYLQADTTTSYVSAGTTTSVNGTNTSWLFDQREYEMENTWVQNTATAQTVVDGLLTNLGSVRKEAEWDAKMVPQLEAMDRITLSHRSYDVNQGSLWDVMVWDTDRWEVEGQNFDYNLKPYTCLSRRLNLDTFAMTIKGREI